MAPQGSIPVAANVLGTIGTVLWCVQLVPQIWYNWKQKKTDGLPGAMMLIWALSGVPFGVYAVIERFNIPVQIQPQIFSTLSLVSWSQILVYNHQWKPWNVVLLSGSIAVAFGGVEALLILTLRGPYQRGLSWPIVLIGVIAAILLACGLVPPYFEIWKRRGRVIGINFVFLTVDWLGALFSLLALLTQHTFDILGGMMYIVCLALELGIFVSHGIWLLRTRKLRKQAKLAGMKFDDLPEARKYQTSPSGGRANRSSGPEEVEIGRVPEEPSQKD
ncbi:PQ-loop repeat [Lasallia pustulata]|uniref:PQ-loop repeat n=1 Tax=Lasallia pustulata TaxID=136370 RepID=A0A1W5CVV1_9LECA|nr:PQ-loop repeat [Lasallia pustulata]